jgi:hypothetical protein
LQILGSWKRGRLLAVLRHLRLATPFEDLGYSDLSARTATSFKEQTARQMNSDLFTVQNR